MVYNDDLCISATFFFHSSVCVCQRVSKLLVEWHFHYLRSFFFGPRYANVNCMLGFFDSTTPEYCLCIKYAEKSIRIFGIRLEAGETG